MTPPAKPIIPFVVEAPDTVFTAARELFDCAIPTWVALFDCAIAT